MKARGFTLTELLVVLSILMVIGGIAWPVTTSMVARGKQAACLTKLRALGVAVESYVQEHNQRLPDLDAGRNSKASDQAVIETVLLPYLQDAKDAFRCPADTSEFAKSGSSYGWNSTQSGRHVSRLAFFGIEARPELTPLIFDKEEWHPDGVNFLYANSSASGETRFVTSGKR